MDAKIGDSGDAISSLPDDILAHILSLLSTKLAVSTSVLSKRWRNLFTLVYRLDLDDSIFLHAEEGKRERDDIVQSFMDFVDRVLIVRGDSPLERFYLKCGKGVDPVRVNRWICDVLQLGVETLILHVDLGWEYRLPSEVFSSKTLVTLSIGSGFRLPELPSDVFFPKLEHLVVDSVDFDDEETFERLILGCPLLEGLVLYGMSWSSWSLSLSIPTVVLLILHCKDEWDHNVENISFDNPNLQCLEYSGLVAEEYRDVNLESIIEARLNLQMTEAQIQRSRVVSRDDWWGPESDDEDDVISLPGDATGLIMGIQNVETLHLVSDALEVLSYCCEEMPSFNYLTFLSINCNKTRGWQALPLLLKNCPKLETLILGALIHHVTDKCGDACVCISREDKGSSLKFCPVKKIEIRRFEGTLREVHLIVHFLRSFPCLKEVLIYTKIGNPELLEAVMRLLIYQGMVFRRKLYFFEETLS